tara:strand:- start:732 stop:1457 length:726 start_codon:yes stop_codon:yes gene_type:complete
MADIHDKLESIAEEFANKVDLAKADIVKTLMKLIEGKTSEEALLILSGINLQKVLELKLATAFSTFEAGAVDILKNTFTTAKISESALRLLLNNARGMVSDEVTQHLSKTTLQSIIDGIGSGQTPSQVIASLDDKVPNIATLVNTTYSQFSNSITNITAEKLPKKTRFVYIGANDEKTRLQCLDKIAFSGANGKTREEIVDQYGDMNNELFNCRHKWEEMSDIPAEQGYEFKERRRERFNA